MLTSQPLDLLPTWGVFLFSVAVLLLANLAGSRLGDAVQKCWPDHSESGVGTMVGASLAFLGFLLALVTGAGITIFGNRIELVVQEANTIGTTYLRAGYLDEPYSTESRQLLREYTDMRLAALDRTRRDAALTRSEEIHQELWSRVEIIARENPESTTVALYIDTVNELFDLHTERVHIELGVRIPPTIMLGLYVMAALTMLLIGIHTSYKGRANIVALATVVLILAMVFLLIVDLDRSQHGMLQVSQKALLDLQRQLSVQP